jgi:5-methylcytosine-specific restriction endonuclease McrA
MITTTAINGNTQHHHEKVRLINLHGGCCLNCGYSNLASLTFHHLDETAKINNVGKLLIRKRYEAAAREAEKCILLCQNCHTELHKYGFIKPRLRIKIQKSIGKIKHAVLTAIVLVCLGVRL